jgi:hypothetical protein
MKFPPFTPSKYLFTLHFKTKFPPLPTSKLALAFRPPYPKWLNCISLLGMKQLLIKKEEDRVTASKLNLYNFRGHLGLDLAHIRITSPIGIGNEITNQFLGKPNKRFLKEQLFVTYLISSFCSCFLELQR